MNLSTEMSILYHKILHFSNWGKPLEKGLLQYFRDLCNSMKKILRRCNQPKRNPSLFQKALHFAQECPTRVLPRNRGNQECPTRVSNQHVKSGRPTTVSGRKCDQYCLCLCLCSLKYVLRFGFVGFILNFDSQHSRFKAQDFLGSSWRI